MKGFLKKGGIIMGMIEVENVTREEVVSSNEELQSKTHPEFPQDSWEKLPGLENFVKAELTADDVLALQGFVETSGVVSDSYQFWKEYGVVTLGDIAGIVRESSDAPYWGSHAHPEAIGYPALLIFMGNRDESREEEKGALLNLGNIFDGNHRLLEEAVKILNMTEEEKDNYRYSAYVVNLPKKYALLFNTYYMVEPLINGMKKILGKDVADIDPKNIMNMPDRFRLLSQRFSKKQ